MSLELLAQLCETAGVPGREERVRDIIRAEIEPYCDHIEIDAMGSMLSRRDGSGGPRVMLACHMDEIGFRVRHIDKRGFVWLNPAGGFDPRNLFARRALVCTEGHGDLPAAMNAKGKPIHLASPEDRKKIPKVTELFLDLGMDAEEVASKVKIGDMVVLDEPFREIGHSVMAKALDNRVACYLGCQVLKRLAADGHSAEIHVVFTCQEEVGLRGAMTSAFAVRPEIGIAVDTTLCCETPGVDETDRVTEYGGGVTLKIMDGASISDPGLVNAMEAIAEAEGIPHQRGILPRGGTDAAALQRAASGARTITVAVGTKYIHTVTEMVHKTDLQAAEDLLVAYLKSI